MSRILLVSPVPTHPTSAGNRSRILTLMHALEDAGHAVFLLHATREPGDEDAMRAHWGNRYLRFEYHNPQTSWAQRKRRWWRRLGSERAYLYDLDSWYDDGLDACLRAAVAEHQITTVLVSYVFFSKALCAVPAGINRLLDTHDVFGNRHRRFLQAGLEPAWYSCRPAAEQRGLNRADTVIAIQDAEREQLSALTQRPVVTVGHLIRCVPQASEYPATDIVFTVASANSINVESLKWFIAQVLPIVRAGHPNALLEIAGSVCDSLDTVPGVRLLGLVDDLDLHYASAQVVVNPMQTGTGLKIKTVEALGQARALVTSPAGADGLTQGPEEAFRCATTADQFGQYVLELLQSPELAARYAAAGLRFAHSYNDDCMQALTRTL